VCSFEKCQRQEPHHGKKAQITPDCNTWIQILVETGHSQKKKIEILRQARAIIIEHEVSRFCIHTAIKEG
jgi:hypothetical protein